MLTPAQDEAIDRVILKPTDGPPSRAFYLIIGLLGVVTAWGVYAWIHQIYYGLGVTGLNAPIFWGVYLVNFVFFIGISHAGTLISSILRITDTEWRRPFTRLAEAVTVFSLPFGAMSVIVDLGRPDRVLNVLKYPHFTSPILWDVGCISAYLFSSCIYFYLALIPDLAICRDRLTGVSRFRKQCYRLLALGWSGSERQWRIHGRLVGVFCVLLFVLVISVHTNVAFVFGMTLKPGWHTAVIGPYFVVGAIFCGVAAVIIIAALLRKFFHFEGFITEHTMDRLGVFLLALSCFWFYFTFVDYLTAFYGHETAEMSVFNAKFFGDYALLFWIMFACCFLIPVPVLAIKRLRTIPAMVVVAILINIGMWLERYTIIIPSGARPFLPYGIENYVPTWTEWSITAAWFTGFTLLFLIFVKFFPVLTIWEIKEAEETVTQVLTETRREERIRRRPAPAWQGIRQT